MWTSLLWLCRGGRGQCYCLSCNQSHVAACVVQRAGWAHTYRRSSPPSLLSPTTCVVWLIVIHIHTLSLIPHTITYTNSFIHYANNPHV